MKSKLSGNQEAGYCTHFHESGRATGRRLNSPKLAPKVEFGGHQFQKQEIVNYFLSVLAFQTGESVKECEK